MIVTKRESMASLIHDTSPYYDIVQSHNKGLYYGFRDAILSRLQQQSHNIEIFPILKSNNKSHPSDYRPVSLPCIVCKLLEKRVHSLLWEHLLEHAPYFRLLVGLY